MGSTSRRGKEWFWGFFSHWFDWRFECIFKTEMYSTRAWKVYNISVLTIYQWK